MVDRYRITKEDFISLLKHLFSKKLIDTVLSGKEKGNHYTLEPDFISDPAKLLDFPLNQMLVFGFARTDSPANSMLRSHKGLSNKIAVIGHACDVRALVELNKKMQVKWENLFLISTEDIGYIENMPMMKALKAANIDAAQLAAERITDKKLILKLKDGTIKNLDFGKDLNVSENCSRCIQKSHPLADITISTYSIAENDNEFIITPQSTRAKEIIKELNWDPKKIDEESNTAYTKEAQNIIKSCTEKREKDLADFAKLPNKFAGLANCTGCGLCVKSCPVCFCPECALLTQLKAKEISKTTFLMTRFAHVGDTCVECGKCNANCAVKVPLALVFQSLRKKFKQNKGYDAGADLNKKVLHLDV